MGLNFSRSQQPNPKKTLGGRYKMVDLLGVGGFGQTFLVQDLHLPGHPLCVLKQLKPQLDDADSLQTARRLFDTEANVLYQLGNHDQIPRLLAHFEEDREFYLAQELIEGNSVAEELTGEPWSEAAVIDLLRDILHPLSFVHEQGVIHRDIKPSNMIRRHHDKKIVLIDFGAVKQTGAQFAKTDTGLSHTISIGTRGYMPNEQLAGHPRFSSDIYAVGIMGIQALTGVAPKNLIQDPETGEIVWHHLIPQISWGVQEFLDRMVCYDFRERFPTATEALAALNQVQPAPTSAPTHPVASPPSSTRPAAPYSPPQPASSSVSAADATDSSSLPGTAIAPLQSLPSTATGATVPVLGSAHPAAPTPQNQSEDYSEEHQPQAVITIPGLTKQQSTKVGLGLAAVAAIGILALLIHSFMAPRPEGEMARNSASQPQPNEQGEPSASPTNPTPAAPSSADLLSQADGLRQSGQFQAALDLYDQIIAQDDSSSDAHWGRCYSLNKLNRYEEAISACDEAIALNPQNPEPIWSKGYALEHRGRPQEALDLYDQAIQLRPNFAEAWNNRGTVLFAMKRHAEAFAAFEKAVAINPQFAEAWSNRGAALWEMRRRDEAIASIDKAIEIQPDFQPAISLREQIRKMIGR
jgi:serine/threonine protein kinase/regulator of sirC expression with transglutaminase-like and TPR domain